MVSTNEKHIEFIRLVSIGETQSNAYKLSVGKKGVSKQVSEVKGSQLAKKYAKEIQAEKERHQSIITLTKDNEVIQKAVANIVTQSQADEVAFRILKDGEQVSDVLIIGGIVKVINRKPTQTEIQRAYQNYNLRFGSNAPAQLNTTITDQRPPSKITTPDGLIIEL
jgi:hypothetical protein